MLQRLFIFLLIFLILPDIYLYFRFIVKLTTKCWLRILYWFPCILLTMGITYLGYFAKNIQAEQQFQLVIGWFSIFFFLFTAPKLILALCTLVGVPFHKWLRWPRTPFICTGLTLGLISIIIIIYGSFIGRTQFDVKEVTYTSSRLPQAFDGYRIVQLSDIHIGSWHGNVSAIQKLVDLVNQQHPDLIVFTGDLVNHRTVELDGFQEILAGLKAKDGVYSVLGNHDYGPYYHWKDKHAEAENLSDLKQRQAAMGWKLLNNEHDVLKQGNDSIALIGVENEGELPFSQHGDLTKAMRGTEGMFQILLSHNPTHWRREVLPQSNVDLMLAGHTHGMQMKLGNYSPASYIYPEWCGMYLEKARGLYVNLGIGYVGLPFRFGAWPEITVLTLRR